MSRLAVLVLAFVVAGCAATPRSANVPRIDGSNEAAFTQSVASLQKTLTYQHSTFLAIALTDIWRTTEAEAAPGSSDADKATAYFARVDGLGYEDVIRLADATPPTVMEQYKHYQPASAKAPKPAMNVYWPPSAAQNHNAGFGGYGAYGALIGMPQYSTSCGSVCSR